MTLSISTLTLQCLSAFVKNSRPKSQWDISQFIPFQPEERNSCSPACDANASYFRVRWKNGWMDEG